MAIRSQAEAAPIQRAEEAERDVVGFAPAREVATSRSHLSWNLMAKVIGLTVFFVGVYLLWEVFGRTRAMFDTLAQPTEGLSKMATGTTQEGPTALDLGMAVGRRVVQVLCLFVLGYVASLISSKGIQLFGVAMGQRDAD